MIARTPEEHDLPKSGWVRSGTVVRRNKKRTKKQKLKELRGQGSTKGEGVYGARGLKARWVFNEECGESGVTGEERGQPWTKKKAIILLLGAHAIELSADA